MDESDAEDVEIREFDADKNCPFTCRTAIHTYEDYKDDSTCINLPFTEMKDRLVRVCKSIITDLEEKGKTITEFVIGKTFLDGVHDPEDLDRLEVNMTGIGTRWRAYKQKGYHRMVVIAAIDEGAIPTECRKINFHYEIKMKTGEKGEQQNTESKKRKMEPKQKEKRDFKIDKEMYTLGLEQALIHHFVFIEPDSRIRNHSFDAGAKWKKMHDAGALYIALKQIEREEEGSESNNEETASTSSSGNIGHDDNDEDEAASTS